MNPSRPLSICLLLAASLGSTGCATLCSWTDTGMGNPGPYSGVRSTFTDWKGRSKPWDDAGLMRVPYQVYFRTVDVPLSLAADTLFLPMTTLLRDPPP